MEPIEIFAACVLTICALHLASAIGVHTESWWRKIARAKKTVTARTGQRSDWYAFFHCADLVGPESPPAVSCPSHRQEKEVMKKRSSNPDKRARASA